MPTATMTKVNEVAIDTSWVDQLPELDDKQTGALRRILEISSRNKGDWSGMLGTTFVGEDFGALRFQIAYMSYALALAHVHRLPAARGLFRKAFDRMIQHIMHPDCWMYWNYVSTGNGMLNQDLGPLPQQWDPVEKDNIMYSAYLQSMALLYHYLFRDDKYAKPEALTLELKTMTWNAGGKRFPYDEKSLNDLIYWQMAENGFLGIACEPGEIFQICNQPNILGFRMSDLINGGDTAADATKGYIEAWKEFGLMTDGSFTTLVLTNSRRPMTIPAGAMNFWLMTLLHSWYPEIVEEQYPRIMGAHLRDRPDGTKWIVPVPHPIFNADPDSPLMSDMGWAAVCASELGDADTLSGLLEYSDRYGNAAWENGSYYYKRRDENFDENGNFIGMDAMAGNALFTLSRLNVKDGFKKLYEGPWDDRHFNEPALIDLPEDMDVRRAYFDPERNALAITLGALPAKRKIKLEVSLPQGGELPVVILNGVELPRGVRRSEGGVTVEFDHRKRSTLVFQW